MCMRGRSVINEAYTCIGVIFMVLRSSNISASTQLYMKPARSCGIEPSATFCNISELYSTRVDGHNGRLGPSGNGTCPCYGYPAAGALYSTLQARRQDLANNTQSLQKLIIVLKGHKGYSECFTATALLTQEARSLVELCLSNATMGMAGPDVMSDVMSVSWPSPQRTPQSLRALELDFLDLYDRNYQLTPWLDITQLKSLRLIRCTRIIPFLTTLATELRASNVPLLQTFHIQSGQQFQEPSVNGVMNSFSGLQDVLISTDTTPLPSVACVAKHGESLTSLTLYTEDYTAYATADLATILEACQNLTQLALDLPELAIGNGHTWDHSWTLRDKQEVKKHPLQTALVSHSIARSNLSRTTVN
jgi:hypothetical protein